MHAELAKLEARWEERFRELERELADARRHNAELVRAQIGAMLGVIQDHDPRG